MSIRIILSFFDNKFGPRVFYSYPKNLLETEIKENIGKLFDVYLFNGYIVYVTDDKRIINKTFEIPSELGRGGVEILMFSIITDNKSFEEEEYISEKLKNFIIYLQRIEKLYLCFHENNEDLKKQTLRALINVFYEEIK